MKICIICAEDPPIGGLVIRVHTIARWMVKNGHQVKVIGAYAIDYPAPDFHVDEGVEIYRIKFNPGKFSWIPARRKLYLQVKKWIENKEVDIVEANDSFGWFTFWGSLQVPLVIRANGTETAFALELGKKVNRTTRFLENASYHRADFYCAASKYIATANERCFELPQKHQVIYNCIPALPPKITDAEREKDLIVFSGSLIEKKGVINLIQASKLLHSKNVKHRLVLNGKDYMDKERGSMKKFLMDMVPETLKEYFIFNGHVTQDKFKPALTRTATVAVFPSFVEAFAFAPMESMISGCPTIFTKRVSGPELLESGKEGLLIEPSNIEELAGAIQWCIEHSEKAQEMGEAGKSRMMNTFVADVVMPQNEAFYQNAISKFRSV